VSQQAALYLKLIVNQHWSVERSVSDSLKPFSVQNKENSGSLNGQQRLEDEISSHDKHTLKQEIFGALDNVVHLTDAHNKVIISSIENIIYNIAQLEYASWAAYAQQQILQRLTQPDERYQMSGLRALKSIFQAFEFEINEERQPLHKLIDNFFPVLESLLQSDALQNSPNYVPLMIHIAKIFFMSVQVSEYQLSHICLITILERSLD